MDRIHTERRPVDGKAIASFVLAVAAAVTVPWLVISVVLSLAAISVSLSSRRTLRANPHLRGTGLSLGGFLIAAGSLVFSLGPTLLSTLVFWIAPPT